MAMYRMLAPDWRHGEPLAIPKVLSMGKCMAKGRMWTPSIAREKPSESGGVSHTPEYASVTSERRLVRW